MITNIDTDISSRSKKTLHRFSHIDIYAIIENLAVAVLKESRTHLKQNMKSTNLKFNHWLVLKFLFMQRADSPKKLADIMHVGPSAITHYLDYLEISELICRNHNVSDRRTITLELTSKGVRAVTNILNSYKHLPNTVESSLFGQEYIVWKMIAKCIDKNAILN